MRREITHRELRVLIQHLPPDSPAFRELNGPWGQTDWHTHRMVSQLQLLRADLKAIVTGHAEQPEFLPTPPPSQSVRRQMKKERKTEKRKQAEMLAVWNRPSPTEQ